MISKELLAKIKKLQIKTERLAEQILYGDYRSAFKGKGLNFESIREYSFGDDIRTIDWKVTARMQAPFVRVYKEERQLSLILILDLSASNDFGSEVMTKKGMIIELASLLASLAIKSNDKIGMLLVTDQIELYLAPKQGKAHVFRLIRDLYTFKPRSSKTNLRAVLKEAIKILPKNSVVFLISDFINSQNKDLEQGFDYTKELKILKQTQDLVAISVRDPREFIMPNIGFMQIFDPELGAKSLVNFNRAETQTKFSNYQHSHLIFVKKQFRDLGLDFLELFTDKNYLQELLFLFLRRERRA